MSLGYSAISTAVTGGVSGSTGRCGGSKIYDPYLKHSCEDMYGGGAAFGGGIVNRDD